LLGFPDRKGEGAEPVELVTGAERGTLLVQLGDETLAPLERSLWQVGERDERSVELHGSLGDVEVVEHLELDPEGYGARLRLAIRNRGQVAIRPRPQLLFHGQERPASAPDRFQRFSLVWERDGSVERRALAGIGSAGFVGGLLGRSAGAEKAVAAPVEL